MDIHFAVGLDMLETIRLHHLAPCIHVPPCYTWGPLLTCQLFQFKGKAVTKRLNLHVLPGFRCGVCRIVGLLYFWSLCELCAFGSNHFFQLSCQFKTFHGHGVSSKTERHRFQMPPSHISDTPVVPFPAFPNTILGRISDGFNIFLKACNRFCLFWRESGTSDGSNLLSSTKRCQGGGRGCGDRNASSSSCSTPKSSQSQLGALAMPGNRTVGWNQHHPACEVVIQLNIRCWS